MPGLVSNIRSLAVPMGVGSANLDILSELGINRAEKVFDQRVLALADPTQYKNDRQAQYAKLKTAVEDTYKKTMAELKASGLPSASIQQLAINAASNTYQSQNAILEADFPSGSTAVAMQSDGLYSFPGMLTAPAISMTKPRRAPAKRRAATRKRK